MSVRLITATSTTVVSLSELKSFLKIDTTDDDTVLTDLLTQAQQFAEQYQGRSYLQQTYELSMDIFPGNDLYIELPFATPAGTSSFSVKYYTTDNTENTMGSTDYWVDVKRMPGRLVLETDAEWPTDTLRPNNGVIITYKAGSTSVTDFIKENFFTSLWIKNACAYLNENREKDLSDFEFGALNMRRVRGVD